VPPTKVAGKSTCVIRRQIKTVLALQHRDRWQLAGLCSQVAADGADYPFQLNRSVQLTWARKLNASAITRPPTAPRPPQIYLCLELEPLKPILGWSWGDLNPRPQAFTAQFYMFSELIWIS